MYHVNALVGLGHEVEIWVPPGFGSPSYFQTDALIREVDFQTGEVFREFDDSALSELSNVDILVMTDLSLLPLVSPHRQKPGTFMLLQHDLAYLYDLRDMADGVASLIQEYRDYLQTTCKIIVISDWIKDATKTKLGLTSYVVRNGVDKTIFHPDPEPLIRSEQPLALIFYDPQPWKGFTDLVAALLGVKQHFPGLRIAIISQGYPVAPAAGVWASFGFPVIYFDRPDQRDMAKVYSSATVFVSASWEEGFGLPGLEAMACGVPVVTTDSGGVREYAVPDETALVTPPRDIPSLTEAILRVLRDEVLRTKLRDNGLKKARQFDWNRGIKKLEAPFRQNV